MLKFEKMKDEIICSLEGSYDEITSEVIFFIGFVHQKIKESSSEAAEFFRNGVELFCTHGTVENEAIFERFEDDTWLENNMDVGETKKPENKGSFPAGDNNGD